MKDNLFVKHASPELKKKQQQHKANMELASEMAQMLNTGFHVALKDRSDGSHVSFNFYKPDTNPNFQNLTLTAYDCHNYITISCYELTRINYDEKKQKKDPDFKYFNSLPFASMVEVGPSTGCGRFLRVELKITELGAKEAKAISRMMELLGLRLR